MTKDQKISKAKSLLVGELLHYIGAKQRSVMADVLRGEEREWMADTVIALAERIEKMPVTYATDGQGKNAIVYLHYFGTSSNFYITEKDVDAKAIFNSGDYDQSFGWANLYGGMKSAEMGYISIKELADNNVELDLYWTPKSAKEVE